MIEVIFLSKTQVHRIRKSELEKPIPAKIYPVIDNDLARDNIENDLSSADLQDLK